MAPELNEPRPLRFALSPHYDDERVVSTSRRLRTALEAAFGRSVDVTVSRTFDVLLRNLRSGAIDAALAPADVCALAVADGLQVVARTVAGAGVDVDGVIVGGEEHAALIRDALVRLDAGVVAELFGDVRFVAAER